MPKLPRRRERDVQRDVVQLLRTIGGVAYELGTTRSKGRTCPHCRTFVPNHDFSTRQTPGLPDVFAIVPHLSRGMWDASARRWLPMWVECKVRGGTLSPEQKDFQRNCKAANIWHVVGGLDEVIAFLLDKGVISEKNAKTFTRVGGPVKKAEMGTTYRTGKAVVT